MSRMEADRLAEIRRTHGINAIIYLQALVGIEETKEKATAGWEAMTEAEQNTTLTLCDQYQDEEW